MGGAVTGASVGFDVVGLGVGVGVGVSGALVGLGDSVSFLVGVGAEDGAGDTVAFPSAAGVGAGDTVPLPGDTVGEIDTFAGVGVKDTVGAGDDVVVFPS